MKTTHFTNPETSGLFSTYLALTSFGIGTLVLILHLTFPYNDEILLFGFFFVVLATLINGITFFYLLYQYKIYRFHRELIAIRMLILLSNIPVTLFYFNMV